MTLTPTEQAIVVDILIFGDDKAENIANRTGYHRNSVSRSAKKLLEEGHLRNKGGGVYTLTDSGRNQARGLVAGGVTPYADDEDDES